jgi:hypothetical protein
MIKIIKKQVEEVVTEYSVEPKIDTLYYVDKYNENVIEYKNCIFKTTSHIIANDYLLEYENDEYYIRVTVDITTGIVKDYSDYFFDYEQAVKIYRERRMEFLKDRIDDLKEYQKELKKHQQALEELENFEKKVVVKNKDE